MKQICVLIVFSNHTTHARVKKQQRWFIEVHQNMINNNKSSHWSCPHTNAQTQSLVTEEAHMFKITLFFFLPGPLQEFIIWVLHWEIQERHTSARLTDKHGDTHTHTYCFTDKQSNSWSHTNSNTIRNSKHYVKWCCSCTASVIIDNMRACSWFVRLVTVVTE